MQRMPDRTIEEEVKKHDEWKKTWCWEILDDLGCPIDIKGIQCDNARCNNDSDWWVEDPQRRNALMHCHFYCDRCKRACPHPDVDFRRLYLPKDGYRECPTCHGLAKD